MGAFLVRLGSVSLVGAGTAIILACSPAVARAQPARPARPLVTGVTDPALFSSPNAAAALRRVRASGATTVLLRVSWAAVAPSSDRVPPGFDAADPNDARYRWAAVDRQVNLAIRAGLDPMVELAGAPRWAEARASSVPYQPDPTAFGLFAHAVATRFSGRFAGLPRVRYWQAWNEPNLTTSLLPQIVNGQPFSPDWYRRMVNAFADGVHSAAPGNVVIAGALAPFRDSAVSDEFAQFPDWGPLTFMRSLLCLSPDLMPTCSDKITFDVWATHPYTSGGPSHHAYLHDDVSLGDLAKMHRVLLAAQRAHHIRLTRHGLGFWVTEFSWDSSPPDPQAVPMANLLQWVPQALYTMWRNGVTHVIWFSLRDDPMATSPYQSGLYFNGGSFAKDRPKPFLANFRFPVVVTAQAAGAAIWGRTPSGLRGRVLIQTTTPDGWRDLGSLTADRYGVFQGRVHGNLGTSIRAVMPTSGDASGRVRVAPFPDHFYNPFGTNAPLEIGG